MTAYTCLLLLLVYSANGYAAQQFKGFDLNRQDPAVLLTTLITHCEKHKDHCPNMIQKFSAVLTSLNHIVVSEDKTPDEKLIDMLELLVNEVSVCKDAECLINFEKIHGLNFHLALSKIKKLYFEAPKYGKEEHQYRISELFH